MREREKKGSAKNGERAKTAFSFGPFSNAPNAKGGESLFQKGSFPPVGNGRAIPNKKGVDNTSKGLCLEMGSRSERASEGRGNFQRSVRELLPANTGKGRKEERRESNIIIVMEMAPGFFLSPFLVGASLPHFDNFEMGLSFSPLSLSRKKYSGISAEASCHLIPC